MKEELLKRIEFLKRKISGKTFSYIRWRDVGYNDALEDIENWLKYNKHAKIKIQ